MAIFDSSKVSSVTASVSFTDAAGNTARVDGIPAWEISDPAIATMTVSADGTSAQFAFAAVGKATVTVRADADLGAGVRELILQGDLEFVAGEAVAGTVTFTETPVAPV